MSRSIEVECNDQRPFKIDVRISLCLIHVSHCRRRAVQLVGWANFFYKNKLIVFLPFIFILEGIQQKSEFKKLFWASSSFCFLILCVFFYSTRFRITWFGCFKIIDHTQRPAFRLDSSFRLRTQKSCSLENTCTLSNGGRLLEFIWCLHAQVG